MSDPSTHITISSRDPRGAGEASLESIFHEATHGWDDELIDGVRKAAADRARPDPPELWHAILFYTAGDATRKILAATGANPAYVPYAIRTGVHDRGVMKPYPPALAAAWQPYLDGKTDFAGALHALIDALPPDPARP